MTHSSTFSDSQAKRHHRGVTTSVSLAFSFSLLVMGCTPKGSKAVRIVSRQEPENVTSSFSQLIITSQPKTEASPMQHIVLKRGTDEYGVPAGELEDWQQYVVAAETNTAFVLVRQLVGRHPVSWQLDRIVQLRLPLQNEELNTVNSCTLFTNRFEMPDGRSWVSELLDVSPDGRVLTLKRAYPTKLERGTRFDHLIQFYDVTTGQFIPKGVGVIASPVSRGQGPARVRPRK